MAKNRKVTFDLFDDPFLDKVCSRMMSQFQKFFVIRHLFFDPISLINCGHELSFFGFYHIHQPYDFNKWRITESHVILNTLCECDGLVD